MFEKMRFAAVLVAIFWQAGGTSALKCFVGSGNSSIILPATPEEMQEHENKRNVEFRIMECGTRGSDVAQFDQIARETGESIRLAIEGKVDEAKKKVEDFTDRSKRDTSGRLDKRDSEDEEEEYACGKLLVFGKAYRSCVHKFSNLKIDCNSALGQLAVCYCHGDNCNGGNGLNVNMFTTIVTSLGLVILARLL